ncbi:MAG: glycosyltransferase family 4 protein [Anaerolineae bacterium]
MSSSDPLVAFNAHLLAGDASYRSAGISVYIDNLLRAFARQSHGFRFQILVGEGRVPEPAAGPVLRADFSTNRPERRILWEQTVLPRLLSRLQADLLHAPAFVAPIASRCAQVITVHDLSFLRYPKYFRTGNRIYLALMTGIACRRAAGVIAVSDFTGQEVTKLLKVSPERVHTVYHGVAPRFRPLPEEDVARFRRIHGLPERFILYMGTLEPRKNLIRLIQAFDKLRDPSLHLVLAGAKGWLYEEIFAEVERLDLTDRVHFPGFVPDEDQAFWYNAARVFAYVSVYEGFGMPVVEALACGAPTVTASTTSLPEAGGSGVLLTPPDDVGAMADALHRVLSDPVLRGRLRELGFAQAARFSWDTTARETAEVYRRALSGGGAA